MFSKKDVNLMKNISLLYFITEVAGHNIAIHMDRLTMKQRFWFR